MSDPSLKSQGRKVGLKRIQRGPVSVETGDQKPEGGAWRLETRSQRAGLLDKEGGPSRRCTGRSDLPLAGGGVEVEPVNGDTST